MRSSPLKPAIVLVRTQEEGNIGAAARAMANMGLDELVLVAPRQRPGRVARAFAVGAGDILSDARVVDSLESALEPYTRIVGTTSARARDPLIPLVTAADLPPTLAEEPPRSKTAVVFGPEASGLTKEELSRCNPWVRVPCSSAQPTLNLAQAVLIVAYELYQYTVGSSTVSTDAVAPASAGEIEGLFSKIILPHIVL